MSTLQHEFASYSKIPRYQSSITVKGTSGDLATQKLTLKNSVDCQGEHVTIVSSNLYSMYRCFQTRTILTCALLWRGSNSVFESPLERWISVKVPPDIPLAAYPGLIQIHLTFSTFSLFSCRCISAGKDKTCELIDFIQLQLQSTSIIQNETSNSNEGVQCYFIRKTTVLSMEIEA